MQIPRSPSEAALENELDCLEAAIFHKDVKPLHSHYGLDYFNPKRVADAMITLSMWARSPEGVSTMKILASKRDRLKKALQASLSLGNRHIGDYHKEYIAFAIKNLTKMNVVLVMNLEQDESPAVEIPDAMPKKTFTSLKRHLNLLIGALRSNNFETVRVQKEIVDNCKAIRECLNKNHSFSEEQIAGMEPIYKTIKNEPNAELNIDVEYILEQLGVLVENRLRVIK